VTLMGSTVTENSADGAGGGIFVFNTGTDPTLTIANSIVAGNTALGSGPDLLPDPNGTLNVNYSLIGNAGDSGITAGTGTDNILNQSAQLGPLQNNGGPTETHALLPGSPAIDAGDPSIVFNPAEFDQRGAPFVRVVAGQIDIGAYEMPAVNSADFDNDNDIDGADFLAWQRGFGTASASPADGDANNDNNVDGDDLSIWETQFGGPAPLAAVSSQASVGSSQWAVGSGQLSAVTAQPAETVAVQASGVGRRAELVDAAIAFGLTRSVEVEEAPALDEETVFAETYADRVFAAEAIVPAGAFADAYERPAANSSDVDAAEDAWLTDELLERVFG